MTTITNSDSVANTPYKVSELASVERLYPTDLLIISSGGKSYSVTFKELLDRILSDLVYGKLKLGTMSYEEKQDYSRIDHVHDELYNRCDFYQPAGVSINSLQVYLNNVNTPINLKSFLAEQKFPTNPKIGTIKLVLKGHAEKTGANFDGWKILGEITLPKAVYTEAASQGAFNESGSNLTIPSFDGYFIKAENQRQTTIIKDPNGQVGLQPHHHDIAQMDVQNLVVKMDATKIQTYAGADKKKPHQGKKIDVWKDIEAEVQISSITLPSFNVGNYGTTEKPQPRNVSVFVMIYVGNRQYYEPVS